MKKRRALKKFIAIVLTFAILTSSIPVISVFATTDNFLDECGNSLEEVEESIEDSYSVITAGDWRTAIFVDNLAWNAFHNQVQKAIKEKYENTSKIVGTELSIIYGENNEESLRGKKGRADIYVEDGAYTYLWEIKPYSYSIEPKKSKALKQLKEYKLSKNNYKIGSNQIEGGVTHLYTQNLRGKYLEFVEYEIKYYVENNGLIFYRFERHVTKREDKEETAVDVAVKTVSSTVEGTVAGGGTGTKQESSENSGGTNIKKIAAAYVMAQIMKSFHWKVYCNQEVSNSVSGAIVIECDRFQNKIKSNAAAAVIFAYISSEGTMEVNAADMESLEELQRDTNSFLTTIKDAGGTDFLIEGLEMALRGEDQEVIDEFIKLIRGEAVDYDKAFGAQPPSDPLIIDLGKKGIELCTIKDGVYFDLDCNGFAEKTAWIGKEDGFLALDRNGNGIIDNGEELFGNQVILSDGTVSSSGFEALAELDTNSDGIIDCNDLKFYDLVVWIDANHNGRTNAEELHSLTELNISSISLNNIEKSIIDDMTGTRIAKTSDVRISNGASTSTVEISEFWFPSNRTDTLHEDIATSGNVPNILKAIARDETGTLYELVYMFNESDDIALKHYYTKQILYFITGANNVQNGSRGGNINAKDLKVIEAFMGHSFNGASGSNPNAAAASILNEMFSDIEKQYYNILNMYASLGVYLKTVCEIEDVEGNKKLCISLLYDIIDDKISNGENIAALVYDLGLYISLYDEANETDCFKEFYEHMAAKSKYYAFVANLSKLHNLYFGTDGNDLLYGENIDECILGADGADTIYGGSRNDIIIGGKGNDTLSGGEGADTYVFNVGDGKDKINNYDRYSWKSDKILFGEGIKPEDIKLTRKGYDMIITNTKSEGDEITLYNAFYDDSGYYYIGSIEYADKTVWDLSKIKSSFAAIEGTEKDDIISGYNSGYNYCTSEICYGGAGNDTINGGSGNDTIYGEEGADTIYGESGNDILIGGKGNDTLKGGEGADTYVFNVGDGKDKINNYDRYSWKSDKILFGEGIKPEDIKLTRKGYDMIITNTKSEGDEITLYNAFYDDSVYYYIGSIEYADKTVWNFDFINELVSQ